MLSGLYGITSDTFLALTDDIIIKGIEASCNAGLNILQYRQKSNSKISISLLKKIQVVCKQNSTLFIINDNVDLALELKADGVHLGKNDSLIRQVREQAGNSFIIGASCYNDIKLAVSAEQNGASYVAFGAMFASTTKPFAPVANLQILKQAKIQIGLPICAIGGITKNNIALIKQSRADMFAVVSDIFNQADIFTATENLLQASHQI